MAGTVADRRLRSGVKAVIAANKLKRAAGVGSAASGSSSAPKHSGHGKLAGASAKINPQTKSADRKPGLVRKSSFEKLRDLTRRKKKN